MYSFSVYFFQGKVKAKDLRGKKKDELLKQLEEQKQVISYTVYSAN